MLLKQSIDKQMTVKHDRPLFSIEIVYQTLILENVFTNELTNNTDNVSEREDITIVNETIGWRYLIHLRQIHEIDTILTFN